MKFIFVLLFLSSLSTYAADFSLNGSTFGTRYRSQADASGRDTHNQLQYRLKLFTTITTNQNFGIKAGLLSSKSYKSSWLNTGIDVDRETEFQKDLYLKRLNVFYKSKTNLFDYKIKFGSMSNKAFNTLGGVFSINGDTYSNLALSTDLSFEKLTFSVLIGEARESLHPNTFERFKHLKLNFTRMSFKYLTDSQHKFGYDFVERSDYTAHRLSYKHILTSSTAITLEYLQTIVASVPEEGGLGVGVERDSSYGQFSLSYYDSKDSSQYNFQQTLYDEVGQNIVLSYKYKFKPGYQLFVDLRHSLKDRYNKSSSAHRSQLGLNIPF